MAQYLEMLENSLKKKCELLDEIFKRNEDAKGLFEAQGDDLERFDSFIEDKERLITELEKLDEGFESLYDRVSEELQENREQYATQIRTLQGLVRKVTEKTVAVQAQENRQKADLEKLFQKQRNEIRDGRRSVKAAMSYYQAQSGSAAGLRAQMLDSKK